LRVDVDGVPELDGLSFATTGERVLALAAPRALFRAAAGLLRIRHGELRTSGLSPLQAVSQRVAASAPVDAPLPPSWKAEEYVSWSARLAGHGKDDAHALTRDAFRLLKADGMRGRKIRQLSLEARRALVIAAALATGAKTLLLEDPLRGLSEEEARQLARHIVRATAGVQLVVFASRASLASPLAIDADEAMVIDGTRVVAQGAPAEIAARERSYAVRVQGETAEFARAVQRRGARIEGGGALFTVDLGDTLRVNDLLDAAAVSGAVVLELSPLSLAFS